MTELQKDLRMKLTFLFDFPSVFRQDQVVGWGRLAIIFKIIGSQESREGSHKVI